jgi:transposase
VEALYLSEYKKKAKAIGAYVIFEDEASFRQDSTLHATWSRRGHQPAIPVTGQRKSVKIFGCVEVFSASFIYRREEVFNAETYLRFLEQLAKHYHGHQVFYIQDNASYHKDGQVWEWFKDNRRWIEVFNLPPYSPEDNAQEPVWKHTRKNGTHNRCFNSDTEVFETLTKVFKSIQKNPEQIRGYLRPFAL